MLNLLCLEGTNKLPQTAFLSEDKGCVYFRVLAKSQESTICENLTEIQLAGSGPDGELSSSCAGCLLE